MSDRSEGKSSNSFDSSSVVLGEDFESSSSSEESVTVDEAEIDQANYLNFPAKSDL